MDNQDGVRHFLKFKRADTDEPHDRAFVWNLLCAAYTYINMPELDDVNVDMAPRKSPNKLREENGLPPIKDVPCFLTKEFNVPFEGVKDLHGVQKELDLLKKQLNLEVMQLSVESLLKIQTLSYRVQEKLLNGWFQVEET